MHCIVTAGGRPEPDDPLYVYTQDKPKALLDMCGRTMLERVVDALQSSRHVEDIVVVGLGSDLGMRFQRPVNHLPDQGGMVSNVLAGIHWMRESRPGTELLLACSSDVPLLTGAIIDDFIERCRPWDRGVYYNFVTREVMEKRFPGSRRTFVKLKGLEIAGGDMLIGRVTLADSHRELWEALTGARKHAWRLARVVGLRMLLKFLFRQVSIRDIEETIGRLVNQPASVILNPHAEIAMDVDKPYQVELARAELTSRAG
jgi:molybdopterin-guanine dinucleotide biosynthesis protein A